MAQRITRRERELLPQFVALMRGEGDARRANDIIQRTRGYGFREEILLREASRFKAARERAVASIPRLRSQRLRMSDAQPVPFHGAEPFRHRYLFDYTYELVHPVTGERQKVTNTMGFRRLERWGRIEDAVKTRMVMMQQIGGEKYSQIDASMTPDMDSIQVIGFYRTLTS